MTHSRETIRHEYLVHPSEMAVLLVESFAVAAGLLVLCLEGAPRLLRGSVALPSWAWASLGFFCLFWALVPALKVYLRSRHGRELPLLRLLASSIAGAIIGGWILTLLS